MQRDGETFNTLPWLILGLSLELFRGMSPPAQGSRQRGMRNTNEGLREGAWRPGFSQGYSRRISAPWYRGETVKMNQQKWPSGESLRDITSQGDGTQYRMQGKSILGLHRTSYRVFRGGSRGRERDGSWCFGTKFGKTAGQGDKKGLAACRLVSTLDYVQRSLSCRLIKLFSCLWVSLAHACVCMCVSGSPGGVGPGLGGSCVHDGATLGAQAGVRVCVYTCDWTRLWVLFVCVRALSVSLSQICVASGVCLCMRCIEVCVCSHVFVPAGNMCSTSLLVGFEAAELMQPYQFWSPM